MVLTVSIPDSTAMLTAIPVLSGLGNMTGLVRILSEVRKRVKSRMASGNGYETTNNEYLSSCEC